MSTGWAAGGRDGTGQSLAGSEGSRGDGAGKGWLINQDFRSGDKNLTTGKVWAGDWCYEKGNARTIPRAWARSINWEDKEGRHKNVKWAKLKAHSSVISPHRSGFSWVYTFKWCPIFSSQKVSGHVSLFLCLTLQPVLFHLYSEATALLFPSGETLASFPSISVRRASRGSGAQPGSNAHCVAQNYVNFLSLSTSLCFRSLNYKWVGEPLPCF